MPLPSKAFDTLLVLLENRHRVVEKEDLLKQVWNGRLVAENNLNQKIAQLRRVLGETPQYHQYIVTIPGQGYHFVASVREVGCGEGLSPGQPQEQRQRAEAARPQHKTIAVLPFETVGMKENEYLGVCLADTLITKLSKLNLPGLLVSPAANTLPAEHNPHHFSGNGKKPGIGFVVKGRIHLFDGSIRITAQFLDMAEGVTLWAEQFDETLSNWFLAEDEVARQIADTLHLKIKSREFESPLFSPDTSQQSDSEATRLYLKGKYFCDKRTPTGVNKGMEYFARAIECDPTLAVAYAGQAQGHMMMGFYEQRSQRETIPLAEAAAAKALALNASLPEAHVTLALAQMGYYFDWDAAKNSFDLALASNPSYAIGHQWLGYLLAARGNFDAAIREAMLAQQMDPLSLVIQASTGLLLYLARRYEQAIAVLQQALEMDNYLMAHLYLGFVYEQQGRFQKALAELKQAAAHYADSSLLTASLIYAHARAGQKDEAQILLAQLQQQAETRYVPPYYMVLAYTGLGQIDEAFAWLQKSYEDRSLWLLFLKVDPKLDPLRSDPRFLELLEMMKLAE